MDSGVEVFYQWGGVKPHTCSCVYQVIYLYTSGCVFLLICLYTCGCVFILVYLYIDVCLYSYLYTYACVFILVILCTYACVYMHLEYKCVSIYIHDTWELEVVRTDVYLYSSWASFSSRSSQKTGETRSATEMTHSRHQALRTYPHTGVLDHPTGAFTWQVSLALPSSLYPSHRWPSTRSCRTFLQLNSWRPCLGWRRRGHVLTIRESN